MYEEDQTMAFTRKLTFNSKNDQNLFHIKYSGISDRAQKQSDNYMVQVISPAGEIKKKEQYREKNKVDQQIEQLKKYSKVNLKNFNKFGKDNKQAKDNKPRWDNKAQKKQQQLGSFEDLQEQDYTYNQRYVKQKNKGKYKRKDMIDYKIPPMVRSKSINEVQKEDPYLKKFKQKKKAIYSPYLQKSLIEESRQRGQNIYYKGTVNCDEKLKSFVRINSDQVDGNLEASGNDMNRVIHQDIIYFKVIEKNQQNNRIKCKIVHILSYEKETGHERQIVGRIAMVKRKKLYIFNPINKRYITFNIRLNQVSKEWLKQRDNKYFLATYLDWPQNSQYPDCIIIGEYGEIGKIEVQTGALLKTHGVYEEEYTQKQISDGLCSFLKQINQKGQYAISEEQIKKRYDLRQEDVFTVDPLTARDFDDALSIKKLTSQQRKSISFQSTAKDIYQVGVHIADASFFVQEGSIIDQQAQIRTTSVYLVHRVIPMLPRILCETMCSLNPGLQRLTLSVWFYMDSEGVVSEGCRYGRSVIQSKARFTYEQAQKIIKGEVKKQEQIEKGYGCVKEEDFLKIAEDICIMNDLAIKNKKKRLDGGSLVFEVPKKCFDLDKNNHPTTYRIQQRFEANFMVEEFMLLANQKVGEVLVKGLGGAALLRRHKFPGDVKIAKFQAFMKKIGESIKINRQTKIQEQVEKILSKNIRQSLKDVINNEMMFLLQRADYFLVGKTPVEDRVHYALNMNSYTHFTSPIRRYPDILVHRQLISIMEAQKQGLENPRVPNGGNLEQLIKKCNINKEAAKKVSVGCEKIFFCLYIKDHPVDTTGIISSVEDWGMRIAIPKYDFRTTIQLKELKNMKLVMKGKDANERQYIMVKCQFDNVQLTVILKEIQEVEVRLEATDTFPIDYKVKLLLPHPNHPNQTIAII